MSENTEQINLLLQKLELLSQRQFEFSKEIASLKEEINALRFSRPNSPVETITPVVVQPVVNEIKTVVTPVPEFKEQKPFVPPIPNAAPRVKQKSDLEKFIGENLINKIGIGITVIGVAIGAKYSIDHDLISPLTRIILGYLVGIGLLFFGIRLKKKYENFSAVLVSGAMAIMYFITYAGYSFYSLMPQVLAFALMVVFTAFTVFAALQYNKQVIAHIALVGGYAVPFLLSNNSGREEILFSYMTIINIGILVLSFKKYWKPLYYTSFGFTWLIYLSWNLMDYSNGSRLGIGLTFATIFFVIFYITFLAYKLIKVEKLGRIDITLLLLNALLFYAVGYGLLSVNSVGRELLGVFTLVNAILHFIAGAIIYKKRLGDKGLFYLVTGLVLVFITITVPVQLDGNWVTLLWAGEAALLFFIGRTKNVPVYEKCLIR